jgi:outer membrane receptor protein involved in Fe transport
MIVLTRSRSNSRVRHNFIFVTLALLLCVGAVAPAVAQIGGSVRDKTTGEAVASVFIALTDKATGVSAAQTLTDTDGKFVFSSLKEGEYTLVVQLIGYDVFTLEPVTVGGAATRDPEIIELQPLEVGISEVVVVGTKNRVVYKLDKRVIDASSNLMGRGGTAVDILENTPSIRVDVDGGVTFRGSSGFNVYVDGKPSLFSGAQALQQIPAGQIENIEIITTPSARYDTDGEVGMINIITKNSSRQGINGMVNLYGSTALSNGADFLLAGQRNKLQWHVAGHWNQPIRESDFRQQKETRVDGVTVASTSDGPRKSKGYHYGLRGGIEYAFTPQTSVEAELSVVHNKNTRQGDLDYAETVTGGDGGVVSDNFVSRDDFLLRSTVNTGSVGFSHKFDDHGHRLSGGFLTAYEGDGYETFRSDLFDHDGGRRQGHLAIEDERRWTVRGNVDYIFPYSETGRLESGYQYSSYLEDGDYKMRFWNPEQQDFYRDENICNTFYFQQGIHSVYLIGADSFGAVDTQIGLRGEHTHRVLRSSIEGADRTTNRFEVFPSVHVGYNMPREQTLTFAYSYRTNRPRIWWMEPYITYRDYYTAEIGNPDIRPEYINSLELSYKNNLGENVLQSSLFYRARRDKIERLRVPFEAGVTLDSMANVGNDRSLGLEVSSQLKLARAWDLNANGNVYHYKVINHAASGGKKETSINYDFTLNNLFRVARNTRIQLDGNFVGPTVTTQGRSEAFRFVNLAVRQQLFSPDWQGTLAFRDVFNSARYRSDIVTADLTSITNIRPRYPVITLTVSYTFNNYTRAQGESRDNRDLFEGTNY